MSILFQISCNIKCEYMCNKLHLTICTNVVPETIQDKEQQHFALVS